MSREAEQSVLGSILLDGDALAKVPTLKAEHFAEGEHRRIFASILSQVGAGKHVDPITVHASIGGGDHSLAYLNALAQAVPSARHVERYAEIVIESATVRQLRELADQVREIAEGEGKAKEKADQITGLISSLRVAQKRVPRKLGELAIARTDVYDSLQRGDASPGMRSGLGGLDRCLGGGLKEGKLIILAARPAVGKTSFALQLARYLGSCGHAGLFLSQEMESSEVVDRAVSAASRINGLSLSTGDLSDADWRNAVDALHEMADMPVWIDDQPALTLYDIRAKARSIKGIKWLIVDYLQLCSSTKTRDSRTAQVGEISRGLKELSKELGITVIALSQLNRDVEKRSPPRPVLADLRDSGEIEQDADSVLFLWPWKLATDKEPARIILEVAKSRGGRTGEMVMRFDGAIQTWNESMERRGDDRQTRDDMRPL